MTKKTPIVELDLELKQRRATRRDRHETVVRALQRTAESQTDLLEMLDAWPVKGAVSEVKSFWISNRVFLAARPAVIDAVADRADVLWITLDAVDLFVYPKFEREDVGERDDVGVAEGLIAIRADKVWNELGITGDGVLVANLDSGVEGNHVALVDRWRGNDAGVPWQHCWFNSADPASSFPEPMMDEGIPPKPISHGTHTMGTITGKAPGNTIGVAWAAKWIASSFPADTISLAVASLEWLADPDGNPATVEDVPDAVNHSWGFNHEICDTTLWEELNACDAAGIVTIFAAGNRGPGVRTIDAPASRPTSEVSSFAVGNADASVPQDDWTTLSPYEIAESSSRGPSDCRRFSALNRIKPEVNAPGTQIYSAWLDPAGSFVRGSGTSFAAPHVTGVAALMREANPNLDGDVIKQMIMNSARDDASGDGNDNSYGYGFIDAYNAVAMALGLPALFAPGEHEALSSATTVNFDWSDVDSAIFYELMVDTDENFGSPVIVDYATVSELSTFGFDQSGTHYWRVRAFVGAGFGDWSETRPFDFSYHFAATQQAPEDGDSGVLAHTDIIAGFNENVDQSTVDTTSFSVVGSVSGQAAGSFLFWGGKGVKFMPDVDFEFGETVTVTLSTDIVSLDTGLPLPQAQVWSFQIEGSGAKAAEQGAVMVDNYPNPFNPNTTIRFNLDESGPVSLKLYDARGRLVRTLVDEQRAAGAQQAIWNGKDDRGHQLASGTYFYRLGTTAGTVTKKMILIK